MAAKQRMRLANEKHSKNITTRGNVPKSLVRYFLSVFDSDIQVDAFHMSLSLVCDYSAVTFTKSHMYHILSMIYIFQAMSCLVQHYELETGWIWKKIIWFILAWSESYIHCIACDYLSTDGQINRHKWLLLFYTSLMISRLEFII